MLFLHLLVKTKAYYKPFETVLPVKNIY